MEDKEFWTKANRSTTVQRTDITEIPHDSLNTPSEEFLTHPDDMEVRAAVLKGDPLWRLLVSYRTGFDQESSFGETFASKEQAISAEKKYAVGIEYDLLPFLRPTLKDFDAQNLSIETMLSIFGRGEPPYFLIDEALQGAGVFGETNRLSEHVISWVGPSGRSELEAEYGENWEFVAALEYCAKHYHPTSLATLAARALVGDSIAVGDYDLGYASRELVMSHGGAERIALQSVDVRKMAGEGGAKASRERKLANLLVLIEEIEKLADTVGLISEDRIVAQAFESGRDRQPNMPKSKRSLEDYGTALRSEEPFKTRYEAVFRRNA
jgi:hypothetical protein